MHCYVDFFLLPVRTMVEASFREQILWLTFTKIVLPVVLVTALTFPEEVARHVKMVGVSVAMSLVLVNAHTTLIIILQTRDTRSYQL